MREQALFNMSSGPVMASPRTLRAASRQILNDYDPEFMDLVDDTTEKMKKLFRTNGDVIFMQGEALLGLEAAAFCTIEPGDKCLNLVSGVYSNLYAYYIKAFGGELVEVRTDYTKVIDPAEVEKAFEEHPDIKILSVVHSETPCGTMNPIKEICPIAKKHGALTIVDSVSGIGGDELAVDDWGIDICCIGPQKCLASTCGVAPVSVSDFAWEKMRKKANPVRYSYMSMLDFKESWLIEKDKRHHPYTLHTNDMVAFNEAITQVLEEGVENSIARHQQAGRMCRAAVRAWGLPLWPEKDEYCTNCVTAVKTEGILDEIALRDILYDKYRVFISGGLKELKGKMFRLGHMGPAAQPAMVAAELAMVEKALADLGYPVKLGSGVGAALEAM